MLACCAMSSVRTIWLQLYLRLLADSGMKLIFHFIGQLYWRLNKYSFQARRMALHIHNVACTHFLFHCSYSLYEPN